MAKSVERALIELLTTTLREMEMGYTPNSGYEMCNNCREVSREDLGQQFRHRDDCKWQLAMNAANAYLLSD